MTKQTTIEAPEGTQTVVITREFDATPEQVFRAHVDPELVVQWLGPDGHTNIVREWDARTGGRWSYVSSDGSGEYGFYGSFHELRPAERIVQTFTFEGWPDGVSLEILELTDLGRPLAADARLALVTPGREEPDPDALFLLRHSCAHVMAEALQRLWVRS